MSLRDKTRLDTKKAIKEGLIKKPKKCSCCNVKQKLEVHHLDYTNALNVLWLCKKCHVRWHKENVCLSVEVNLTYDQAKALHLIRIREHRTIRNQVKHIIHNYINKSLEKQK